VQEIEVKYRIADVDAVVARLGRRGVHLGPPGVQDDQAYAPVGWRQGDEKVGVTFARLRTHDDRHVFTVKRPVDNELACAEYETEVADRQAMHHAVLAMGFDPTIRIVKRRRTARVGVVTVCVDEVEDAGCFLEVERVVGPGLHGAEVQAELDRFARSLGVQVQRVEETYDSLVHTARIRVAQAPQRHDQTGWVVLTAVLGPTLVATRTAAQPGPTHARRG